MQQRVLRVNLNFGFIKRLENYYHRKDYNMTTTLSNEQLKQIYFGALRFEEVDGYLAAFQYTAAQQDYFARVSQMWYDRCTASTSKTLEFITDADEISFEYRLVWAGSLDSVDVEFCGEIFRWAELDKIPKEGKLTFKFPAGEKYAGERYVRVYLPADSTMHIRNFTYKSPTGKLTPGKKGAKVLWMGDSITQGYGPYRSAYTYVSVANRILGYDILNQGIGGYVYDKNVLVDMGYKPEKIIIAMGTNQHRDTTDRAVREYYAALAQVYEDTPVVCVTPLWRGDTPDECAALLRFSGFIRDVCAQYGNIAVVDGFGLVPHEERYFLDRLHPNVDGCVAYGEKLAEEIGKIWG